jgi:hypothetical protein
MGKHTHHISTAFIDLRYYKLYNHYIDNDHQGYPYCLLIRCKRCRRILKNEVAIVIHGSKTSPHSKHKCLDCYLITNGKRDTLALLNRHYKILKGTRGKGYIKKEYLNVIKRLKALH